MSDFYTMLRTRGNHMNTVGFQITIFTEYIQIHIRPSCSVRFWWHLQQKPRRPTRTLKLFKGIAFNSYKLQCLTQISLSENDLKPNPMTAEVNGNTSIDFNWHWIRHRISSVNHYVWPCGSKPENDDFLRWQETFPDPH